MINNQRLQSIALKNEHSLSKLVENQTTYTFNQCELHVFETHQAAENVGLLFNDFVYTAMLRGKKVMHLKDRNAFDYLPGESVIVRPNELMEIDFPEANKEQPTQCLALGISNNIIQNTLDLLNEHHEKLLPEEKWQIDQDIHHIINNEQLNSTVNRIINLSKNEQETNKDIFIELALKEMLVRLMQTQARHLFDGGYKKLSNSHPFAYVIDIIKSKLHEKIDFDQLAKAACMSRANFYKKFKEQFGITPSKYVVKERLKIAKGLLTNSQMPISSICFTSGFENLSHFTTTFLKETGNTPSRYRKMNATAIN